MRWSHAVKPVAAAEQRPPDLGVAAMEWHAGTPLGDYKRQLLKRFGLRQVQVGLGEVAVGSVHCTMR